MEAGSGPGCSFWHCEGSRSCFTETLVSQEQLSQVTQWHMWVNPSTNGHLVSVGIASRWMCPERREDTLMRTRAQSWDTAAAETHDAWGDAIEKPSQAEQPRPPCCTCQSPSEGTRPSSVCSLLWTPLASVLSPLVPRETRLVPAPWKPRLVRKGISHNSCGLHTLYKFTKHVGWEAEASDNGRWLDIPRSGCHTRNITQILFLFSKLIFILFATRFKIWFSFHL